MSNKVEAALHPIAAAVVARTWRGRLEVTYCYDPNPNGWLYWVSVTKAPLLWGPRRHIGLLSIDAPTGDLNPADVVEDMAMFYAHVLIREDDERAWWKFK